MSAEGPRLVDDLRRRCIDDNCGGPLPAAVLAHYRAILDATPPQDTEPGAMDDLLQEMTEIAPGRRAATTLLLGGEPL